MGVWCLCGHSWCSFPHLKGSAKAEEGWRLRDSQERKISIKAIRPQGRPYLAAVWFSPRDIDISSHRVPLPAWRYWNGPYMLENGSLCGNTGTGVSLRAGLMGLWGCRIPQSTHLDTFPRMPVPQPEPVIKPSKLLKWFPYWMKLWMKNGDAGNRLMGLMFFPNLLLLNKVQSSDSLFIARKMMTLLRSS